MLNQVRCRFWSTLSSSCITSSWIITPSREKHVQVDDIGVAARSSLSDRRWSIRRDNLTTQMKVLSGRDLVYSTSPLWQTASSEYVRGVQVGHSPEHAPASPAEAFLHAIRTRAAGGVSGRWWGGWLLQVQWSVAPRSVVPGTKARATNHIPSDAVEWCLPISFELYDSSPWETILLASNDLFVSFNTCREMRN